MNEVWKPIVGFENDYDISNYGNVKSKKRGKELIMRPVCNNKGYPRVVLSVKNKGYRRFVHRLVAEHFVDNPDNKPQVNHVDGDKKNNHASNLQWMTNQENRDHAIKRKLHACGENAGGVKFTEKEALEIIRLYKTGNYTQSQLGRMFGVHQMTISRIVRGTRWKYLSRE